ncbi:BTB/POZ domain-containing protein At4g30940-like [Solanum lycopersicum]|uniref:BTB/POZ domain-containing protein At4g30940-like n=1 Tax=Solanum lycopersicum TaxID=4081 RepID=UPI0002769CD1|nr:BTB/POZ domain-containing protein At4g30940-like [Solanum lycopersicum]
MGTPKGKVKLNVGGRIFETTATTLEFSGQNSLFRAMLDENWNLHSDSAITEHFIDRDPDYFAVLLNLLRTGELYIPPNINKKLVYKEAEYYGILDHVRSAECDKFDGNRPRLARSITGWSVRDGGISRAIEASSNGWCCVAHGSVVHVYDWMLEERPTINLDYHKVNNLCWIDSENIVVSSEENLDSGGMGLFNASTGELKYKFQVTDVLEDYTAGALSVSSDNKLFSSCTKSTSNKHGIGVWDQVTDKQIDFLDRPPYKYQHNASKLQWLHDTKCLMVAGFHPRSNIILYDVRNDKMVWSKPGVYASSCYDIAREELFRDVIAIEESCSICLADWNECLGFMDLRSNGTIYWRNSVKGVQPFCNWGTGNYSCYPKLAFHEGQLFSSLNDTITVYSGSDWVPTSQFHQKHGGPIWDFSIGGDRLFSLHRNEDVLDVWETPRMT